MILHWDETFINIVSNVIVNFYKITNSFPLEYADIYYCDDICKDVNIFVPDKPLLNVTGGLTIPPSDSMKNKFTVIINKSYEAEMLLSLAHELCHAKDFNDYCKINNIVDYSELSCNNNFQLLRRWSEFHTKLFDNHILLMNAYHNNSNGLKEFFLNDYVCNINNKISKKISNKACFIDDLLWYIGEWVYLSNVLSKEELDDILQGEQIFQESIVQSLYDFLQSHQDMETMKDSWKEFEMPLQVK